MAQKKNTGSMGTAVAVGAGVAVLSAAAFLLFGPEGKKHQKDLKSWMIKMKADVMEKMEQAKDLTGETYESIVASVEEKYKAMKGMDAADIAKEAALLRKNWRAMMQSAKGKTKKGGTKKPQHTAAKKKPAGKSKK